ncbi:MAG: right-handed parallel beta-helix repeat-containing protein [Bdellovibrionota bacterium]
MAANFYVSANGNDGNSGTSTSSAWKTINKVNSRLYNAGDRILFEGGVTFSGKIYITKGGASANPLTITSYGNGKAVINGGGAEAFFAYNTGGIDLKNIIFKGNGIGVNGIKGGGVGFYNDLGGNIKLSRVYIDNVEIYGFGAINTGAVDGRGYPRRSGGEGISIGGWNGASGFQDVQITNSNVHDNEGNGITVYGLANYSNQNIKIINVTAYNNTGRTSSPDSSQYSGSGIVIYSARQALIERCTAYNNGTRGNGTAGIMILETEGAVIQHNTAYNNRTAGDADGDGFDLDGGTKNSVLQYNFAYGNDGAGILIAEYPGSSVHSNNIVRYNISAADGGKRNYGSFHLWNGSGAGMVRDLHVYNNTFFSDLAVGGTKLLIQFAGNTVQNVNFRNNIFAGASAGVYMMYIPAMSPGLVFHNNNYWAGGTTPIFYVGNKTYNGLSEWQLRAGQDTVSGISENPRFANPRDGANGFKILTGSPMIDRGIAIQGTSKRDYFGSPTPFGKGYDIGAHEYSTGTP